MSAIRRYRGDTVADEITITDEDGDPVNIAGRTFLLTVNTLKAPPDDTTEVFQLVGVITNAPLGIVEFAPDATQADQTPGKYYYDIEMTNAGAIKTIVQSTYTFVQDITK